jgi:hypothetical protein
MFFYILIVWCILPMDGYVHIHIKRTEVFQERKVTFASLTTLPHDEGNHWYHSPTILTKMEMV